MEAPEAREPGEEEEPIFDAAADLEGAGETPGAEPPTVATSSEERDLLADDREKAAATQVPSPASSLVMRTLIDFVRPGVRGTRVNARRKAAQEITCPSCQAKLVVSKKASGRQVLCLCCETLIDHAAGAIVLPGPKPAPPAMPAESTFALPGAPAESTPALKTLDLPEEGTSPQPGTKAWKDWKRERELKKRTGKVERPREKKQADRAAEVERTKAVLARFRERAGLSGEEPDPPLARPIRSAGPPPVSPFRVAILVLVAAGLASGATALVLSAADGDGRGADRSGDVATDGASGGDGGTGSDSPAAEVPPPREVTYLGYVSEEGAPILVAGTGAGCRVLTRDRVGVWLVLATADLEAIRERVRDPRARVCVRGKGTLYSARDPDVAGWVPAGIQVEHVLVAGGGKLEFVTYEEYLHTASDIR